MPIIQSVAFFEPYKPNAVAETIRTKIGIGGPPPLNKWLNKATSKTTPPKNEIFK